MSYQCNYICAIFMLINSQRNRVWLGICHHWLSHTSLYLALQVKHESYYHITWPLKSMYIHIISKQWQHKLRRELTVTQRHFFLFRDQRSGVLHSSHKINIAIVWLPRKLLFWLLSPTTLLDVPGTKGMNDLSITLTSNVLKRMTFIHA